MTAPTGATVGRTTFMRSCRVDVDIDAEPAHVWLLLTGAGDMARWNSSATCHDLRREAGRAAAHHP